MDGYNILALILFAIGTFFEIVNIGVFFANRKGGSSSGVPFFAGIFFLLGTCCFFTHKAGFGLSECFLMLLYILQ